MNTKNINIFELYADKIVLGICALAGLYLVYTSWVVDPYTVPGAAGDVRKPDQVEDDVTNAISDLKQKTDAESNKKYTVQIPNFVADLNRKSQTPLPPTLLAAVPVFGPPQYPVPGSGLDEGPKAIVTIHAPTVPSPTNLRSNSEQGVVLFGPAPATAAGAPADKPTGTAKDLWWVKVDGSYSIANTLASPTWQALPAPLQRVIIYRFELQRLDRNADGSWPDDKQWHAIPPVQYDPPANVDLAGMNTADLEANWNAIDGDQTKIVTPAFYPPAGAEPAVPGAAPAPPPPPPVRSGPGGTRRVTPAAPAPTAHDDRPDAGAAAPPPPTAAPEHPADAAAIKTAPEFSWWAYDETVTPGHDYRYRVRAVLINPLFKIERAKVIPEGAIKEAFLLSAWVPVPGFTHVEADKAFFLTTKFGGGADQASFRIFKYQSGTWFSDDDTVPVGLEIGQTKNRSTPRGPITVDYATGYTLVDVVPDAGGRNVKSVVLMDNHTGRLLQRSLVGDLNDPRLKDLENKLRAKPVTSASVTPGG